MQRSRAPVLIGGQRATILQQNSGASVQQGASTATRVVRPVSGQAQQPGMAQAPVRMVKNKTYNIFGAIDLINYDEIK